MISFTDRVTRLPVCNSLGHAVRILDCRHVARRLGLWLLFNFHYVTLDGRDSSFAIAIRCGMDGPGLESRSVQNGPAPPHPHPPQPPVQLLPDLILGGKEAGGWRWPPTPSSAEVKERVLHLWAFVACSSVTFIFTFTLRYCSSYIIWVMRSSLIWWVVVVACNRIHTF
jgi:hypothetical protein